MIVRIGLLGAVEAAAGKTGPALLPDLVASIATTHSLSLWARSFAAAGPSRPRDAPTLFSAHFQR